MPSIEGNDMIVSTTNHPGSGQKTTVTKILVGFTGLTCGPKISFPGIITWALSGYVPTESLVV